MSKHIPRKRFGQHFLHDQGVIRRIIDSLAIQTKDHWVEIGPGQGALTDVLPKSVQHLYLIELDRDLATKLQSQYDGQANITVVNQDILTVDFLDYRPENQKLRLLGNLPYNISTPIFFHLAEYTHCISDMTFMVQKEVADRLVAHPGNKNFGRLTLSAGLRFEITKLFDVGPGAFNPPPKVNSSVIRLVPYTRQVEPQMMQHFDLLVKTAFLKRRKTLRNSLSNQLSAEKIELAGIDPQTRAETLTIDDFLKLAEVSANAIIRPDKGSAD